MHASLIFLTLCLAFANGANDVSKGVATLVGSGVARQKLAIYWGALWTFAGALAAAAASQGLVAAFSGKGLLASPTQDPSLMACVAVGAILWVLLANMTAMPVSTTHSITGALIGAGLALGGIGGLKWQALGQKFFLPLILSPFLSLALMLVVFSTLKRALSRCQRYCLCVQVEPTLSLPLAGGAAAMLASDAAATLTAGTVESCGASSGIISRLKAVDALHWLSAGLISFARGMNDTPKILALAVSAAATVGLGGIKLYALVALAMGLGSLLSGLRVTETLAKKVTPMSPEEGFSANLVTAILVGLASRLALPVSTTHVSSGAIMGIGLPKGSAAIQWKTVREMAFAWVVTLPVSAAVTWAAFFLLRLRH